MGSGEGGNGWLLEARWEAETAAGSGIWVDHNNKVRIASEPGLAERRQTVDVSILSDEYGLQDCRTKCTSVIHWRSRAKGALALLLLKIHGYCTSTYQFLEFIRTVNCAVISSTLVQWERRGNRQHCNITVLNLSGGTGVVIALCWQSRALRVCLW